MTHMLTLDSLRAAASSRPAGYLEDVLANGTIDGEFVVMSDEAYSLLVAKYRGSKGGSDPAPKLQDMPGVSLLDKVRNFTKAAVAHVAAGLPTCSDEEIERRYAICQGCEFFENNSCGKCGCPISRDKQFVSKLAWADQKCPVGKWDSVQGR